jgi:predicted metalloprotease with PDZ domain
MSFRGMRILAVLFLCLLVLPFSSSVFAKSAAPVISVAVDATNAPRRIFHAKLSIPVAVPGPDLTLFYPKWIPGEHGPTGPIQELTGLKFSAKGQELKWRRDLLDGWMFHVELPAGVNNVEAELDYLSPAGDEGQGIYTGGASATPKMTVISWNTLVLYPQGWTSDELTYKASLRLPAGWKSGTSLNVTSNAGGELQFAPVSLTMLVDSPVIAGEFLKVVPLAENPPTEMDIAADSAEALDAPPEVWEHYKSLVDQAQKLFGAHHYRDYHFIYSLSDHVAHFGLEHHESNDSRVGERGLVDETERKLEAGLLPHEYVHSWNGKYRRPADLATSDYEQPMKTDLLWVYEGLTSYLGDVLSARSGLRTPEELRDSVALIAAALDRTPGRNWRNLQDTADGVPAMQGAPGQWESWRRDLDYYDEDVLNWLWVDMIIRQQTQGNKSIDDFCKLSHGGQSTAPMVKPYTFDDVVNALNQVAHYDWRKFWTDRLTNHGPGAPLGGIEASGWKLVYDETPSELFRADESDREHIGAGLYSLGLALHKDGVIGDTIEGMPAAKAGIGPGMRLVAVNGRKFTADVLRDVLRSAKANSNPIELLVENATYYKTYKVDYHDGEKYPHLVRDPSRPDTLSEIIKAR